MAINGADAARDAGLRYVTDAGPGIRRRRSGRSFAYVTPTGKRIRDRAELRRIARIAVPPAWTDVWISPDPLGHIQATGRDERGRKQYRYHERWRTTRDADKYGRLASFARALPLIRRRAVHDLATPGLSRDKVLACVLILLGSGVIRVGNEEYARANRSFGLTTLRSHHAEVRGSRVSFRFRGKAGKEHVLRVVDQRLARVIRRCQELPGQTLFEYVEDGAVQSIGSSDVNEHLRAVSGVDATAKDFRTWVGTVLLARALASMPPPAPATRAVRSTLNEAVALVATQLGNTPAVCRKSYIHPAVIDAFERGELHHAMAGARGGRTATGLSPEERAVLRLIEARAARRVLAKAA